jgi:hypothetical protein
MNPIEALLAQLFGGLTTPATPPTAAGMIDPTTLAYLPVLAATSGIPADQLLPMLMSAGTAGTPAGGANPGLFTSIGGALDPSNPMTGLLRLVAGVSQLPFASQGQSAINKGLNLLENPSAFMGLVKSLAKPLNKQLVQTVQQGAQGSAAEAGLGQAAGAIASGTAKALAPYEESNLQNAQGTALQQIQQLLANANLPGSPYANIAKMFTGGGGLGGDLGF